MKASMKKGKEPLDESGIIKNVRILSAFIDDAYLKSDMDRYGTLQSDFRLFYKQIEGLYNYWFPGAKNCTDEDIINRIYANKLEEKDWKTWVKYSMTCLLRSSDRVFTALLKAKETNNAQEFQGELNLLHEIAFEAPILLQSAFKILENRDVKFGHGKRPYITARETYNVSTQILTKHTYPKAVGGFALSPSAIIILRQSIELWLLEIFGIEVVTYEDNEVYKLNPDRLFDLIDNKGVNVKIPVSKPVITKIHAWTQSYVHAGLMKYTWEIEHAQHVLSPIFYDSKVIIKEVYYNDIEKHIRKLAGNDKLKLHRADKPASILVK